MATNHPNNHNVPESISFIILLNELQRRSAGAVSSGGFHPERDLLWEELVEREHSLEQRILYQLEHTYSGNQGWWTRLYHSLILRMNKFASAFNPSKMVDVPSSNREQHI